MKVYPEKLDGTPHHGRSAWCDVYRPFLGYAYDAMYRPFFLGGGGGGILQSTEKLFQLLLIF